MDEKIEKMYRYAQLGCMIYMILAYFYCQPVKRYQLLEALLVAFALCLLMSLLSKGHQMEEASGRVEMRIKYRRGIFQLGRYILTIPFLVWSVYMTTQSVISHTFLYAMFLLAAIVGLYHSYLYQKLVKEDIRKYSK